MKKMRYLNAWVRGTQLRKGNSHASLFVQFVFLIAIFSCLSGPLNLKAQTPHIDWIQQDSIKIGFQLDVASDCLVANQQFSVKVYLKTLLEMKYKGGTFSFKFPDPIFPNPINPFHIPGNSWLGSGSELLVKCESEVTEDYYKWTLSRNDGELRSGFGIVLILNLKVGNQTIGTDELMKALKGGLIVIDNIDMLKAGGKPEAPSLTSVGVYPNPFLSTVNFGGANPENLMVRVFDMHYQMLLQASPNPNGQLNLDALPSGNYWLEVKRGEKLLPEFFKIVKQ